jgi:hypothetical protein
MIRDTVANFVHNHGQDVLAGVGIAAASMTWIEEVDHALRILASIGAIVAAYFSVMAHIKKRK